MLENMMDKLSGLEEKLHQKADVKVLEVLECRIKLLEDCVEDTVMSQVRDIKVQLSQNSDKLTKVGNYGTLRLLDSSPIVWSFCLLDTSPTGHSPTKWSFRLQDICVLAL